MRNARSRPFGATCIHTALSNTRSNRRPSARRARRSGSASFIQTTRWWESRAGPIAQGARFHRNHLPSLGREPIGVPPRAGADIAGETGFGG